MKNPSLFICILIILFPQKLFWIGWYNKWKVKNDEYNVLSSSIAYLDMLTGVKL